MQHKASLEPLAPIELETIVHDHASYNNANCQPSRTSENTDRGQDESRSSTIAEEQSLHRHKEEAQLSSDPRKSSFSAEVWMKRVNVKQSLDPVRHPAKTAGIAFCNLGVFGYKSSSYIQPTVGNSFLSLFGYIHHLFRGRNSAKVQILDGFNGLVRSGEMLLVLGRPGR
jgi:ATP-binding cassette, subfamily G (WHITE), member 2, PDR